MLEEWLGDKSIVHALEQYKDDLYVYTDTDTKYVLNIPATIAAYFLFYMVTIRDEHHAQHKSDFILNVNLITEFMAYRKLKPCLEQLSATHQIKVFIENGFNIQNGFIWDKH